MEYSFPHYLLAKQSVDDRALNRDVFETLKANLPASPLHIVEVGAGIGTMPVRLLCWNALARAEYLLVDEMRENIDFARGWLPQQAQELGLQVDQASADMLRVFDETHDIRFRFECADVFDFITRNQPQADLLIAHAFLDLLPMPGSLPRLFSLLKPGGLAWLTINFDGVTSLEPALDPELDARIERLYHETMDTRLTGGDSRSGRHLFAHVRSAGAQLLAAGASDWVVFPHNGSYPADEAYFLNFILHFFELSLSGNAGLKAGELERWLEGRRVQLQRGELVYIAHQMDFLASI